ncbi:MAG TPA: hypothetical protein VKA49_07145 [Flavitalea sp.]|nr:hypothetical protein [Flavitalea sp.]
MKKLLIGAIVGGIIIFLWQFLSFALLNLHGKAFQYTPKQNEIMNSLNSLITEDGQYLLPGLPPDATSEQHEAAMKSSEGKPWAMVSYHKAMEMNMGMNMIRGLVVDIIAVALLCWIISKMNLPTFGTVLTASIFTGLIVFFTAPYTGHIWYDTFDIMAYFMDALVGWGACGLWLGWWYSRRAKGVNV